MGLDDDSGNCPLPEHDWDLTEMDLGEQGATMHYECTGCRTLLVRGPGKIFPD